MNSVVVNIMPSVIVEVLLVNAKDGQQIDKSSKKIKGNSSAQKWAALQEFIEKTISAVVSFSNYTYEVTGNNGKVIANEKGFDGMLKLQFFVVQIGVN